MTQLKAGMSAASFTLRDTDGRQIGFDAAGPGRKLLVFYKVTCPTCQFGMPYFDRLFQAFSGSGVPVFAVVQDEVPDAQSFAQTYGVTIPQLVDSEPYRVSNEYRIKSVPTFFIIGEDGAIEIASESFNKADIERSAELLAESTGVEVPQVFEDGESVPDFKPG